MQAALMLWPSAWSTMEALHLQAASLEQDAQLEHCVLTVPAPLMVLNVWPHMVVYHRLVQAQLVLLGCLCVRMAHVVTLFWTA
jgi:hypothetical protein